MHYQFKPLELSVYMWDPTQHIATLCSKISIHMQRTVESVFKFDLRAEFEPFILYVK